MLCDNLRRELGREVFYSAPIQTFPAGRARRVGFRTHHALTHPIWGLTRAAGSFRLHSQGKQDGILLYLFQHLGITNKYFVEFGFNSPTHEGETGANTFILWKHFGWCPPTGRVGGLLHKPNRARHSVAAEGGGFDGLQCVPADWG